MTRSKSSQLISNRKEPPRSPSHHSYLCTNNLRSARSTAERVRSKSVSQSRKSIEPRVSHHQPCPNHVGGKTFAEMGTQTLPRPKKKVEEEPVESEGCMTGIKHKYVQPVHLKLFRLRFDNRV